MKSIFRFLLISIFFLGGVKSATIVVTNDKVVISGELSEGDFERVSTAISSTNINTVEFDNCLGGLVNVGYNISRLIDKKQLNTVAKNQCHSSCALGFMAGRERIFSNIEGDHFILLHAARNIDSIHDLADKINPALMRYIALLTKNKLAPELLDMIRNSNQQGQGLVFWRSNFPRSKQFSTRYCDGSEGGKVANCRVIEDADAVTSGIVTSR